MPQGRQHYTGYKQAGHSGPRWLEPFSCCPIGKKANTVLPAGKQAHLYPSSALKLPRTSDGAGWPSKLPHLSCCTSYGPPWPLIGETRPSLSVLFLENEQRANQAKRPSFCKGLWNGPHPELNLILKLHTSLTFTIYFLAKLIILLVGALKHLERQDWKSHSKL